MNLLLSCRQVNGFLPEYQEGLLRGVLRLRLELHLKACKPCRAMLESLQAIPALFRKGVAGEAAGPSPEARHVLDATLARLEAGGRVSGARPSRLPAHAMPAAVRKALEEGTADRPMRLLGEAYRAIRERGEALEREPYLPKSVLDELPAPETWKWSSTLLNGCRSALLAKDAEAGTSLHMILLPPGRQFPDHRHRGDEHVLLLAGQAEDTLHYGSAGDWFHEQSGSEHRALQGRGQDVCWTLTRLEGRGVHLLGWRGVIQSAAERVS